MSACRRHYPGRTDGTDSLSTAPSSSAFPRLQLGRLLHYIFDGYVGDALNGNMAFKMMLLLVVLKLLTVTTSYASGNAGGIFGPALFIGAMLGGTVGTLAHGWFPAHTATPGAYALVGMGAVFAGIVRAPMTSLLMIFEMTQDYAVIVPLMIANMVSLFISSRLQREPIYEALAVQDGIHLPTAATRQQHGHRQVRRIMQTASRLLPAEMTVRDAMERVRTGEVRAWLVTDRRGVIGVINFARLERELAEGAEKKLGELVDALAFPHVHADQGLDLALDRMGANQIEILPVVSRADVHKLEGILTENPAFPFPAEPPHPTVNFCYQAISLKTAAAAR